jgi:hypothetical protein
MGTFTIQLTPGTENALRQKASASGKTLEAFVQELVQKEACGNVSVAPSLPVLSLAEFEALLDELADSSSSAGSLPVDFSRADIYADHD